MYKPILATLGYVMSADGSQTLLIHRNKRAEDQHLGKYNGLGGKLEPDEDILSCIRREIAEESGLFCSEIRLRGTINWTGFGPNKEDWFGFIFRIDRYAGTPKKMNHEGELSWHPVKDILALPMWEGDRYFLPLVFDQDPRVFHGYMPYAGNKPIGWQYTRF